MILEDLLIQSGIDYEPLRGHADEVQMACPFCVGQRDQTGQRKVFGMNLSSGKAHCHRCDWKSRSMVFTARELCRIWNIDFSWRLRLSAAEAQETVAAKAPKHAEPSGMPDGYEQFGDLSDEIARTAFNYLRARRITRADIAEYQIGFAGAGEYAWRILFPVIGEDDVVYGCAARDFSGQNAIKYLNTPGMKLLFNGQRHAKTAVVVEGPTDTLAVNRVLKMEFPQHIAVGALGSVITAEQLAQLSKYDQVIHFPDNDVPGLKGAIRRADITAEAGIKTLVIAPSMNGSDPGSMLNHQIADSIRSARPWTKAEKLRMRLRALK